MLNVELAFLLMPVSYTFIIYRLSYTFYIKGFKFLQMDRQSF